MGPPFVILTIDFWPRLPILDLRRFREACPSIICAPRITRRRCVQADARFRSARRRCDLWTLIHVRRFTRHRVDPVILDHAIERSPDLADSGRGRIRSRVMRFSRRVTTSNR